MIKEGLFTMKIITAANAKYFNATALSAIFVFLEWKSGNPFAVRTWIWAAGELMFSFTTQRGEVVRLVSAFIQSETLETALILLFYYLFALHNRNPCMPFKCFVRNRCIISFLILITGAPNPLSGKSFVTQNHFVCDPQNERHWRPRYKFWISNKAASVTLYTVWLVGSKLKTNQVLQQSIKFF